MDRWPVLAEPVESVGTSANDCCAHAFIVSELLTKFQPLDVDGEFSEIGEQLAGRTSDGAHVVFLS
ncbi:MAG: hypothetical protein ACI88S_002225 [Ilumatobacter sp.]